MARKTERWMAELFPVVDRIFAEYESLPPRELVIVGAAVLDSALAELLSRRLNDFPKESESFLGLNGEGMAPAGTFGARIQLALLLGIISPEDAKMLRLFKTLRNLFAHRVKVDLLSSEMVKATKELFKVWMERIGAADAAVRNSAHLSRFKELGSSLETNPESNYILIMYVFGSLQLFLHGIHEKIVRVGLGIKSASLTSGKV